MPILPLQFPLYFNVLSRRISSGTSLSKSGTRYILIISATVIYFCSYCLKGVERDHSQELPQVIGPPIFLLQASREENIESKGPSC